ncbi:MAG: Leukotoxin, partial [Pseudomonadota bacterium]
MAVTLPKPSITDIVDDKGAVTGSVDAGGRTDDTVLLLRGKARAGTTVEVFDGDTSLGSAKADKSGNWTFTTAELDQGGHAFKVVASNARGDTSPASTVYRITVDTNAPAAPVFTVRDDAGRLVGDITADTRTDDTSPILRGTTEARATVEVFDGRKSLGTVTANSKGVWSYVAEDLKDGLHTLRAVATDTAGNSGDAHTFRLTVDTKPPKAPTLASVNDNVGTVKGNVADGKKTDDTTLVLKGIVDAESEVTLYDYDTRIGIVSADGKGQWSFTTDELDNGSVHVFTARVSDAVGNLSDASASRTVTIATGAADTVAPFAPSVDTVTDDAGEVTGAVKNKGQSDDATLTLSGAAEAGSTVQVFDNGDSLGTVKAGKSGDWTFTTPTLADGPHGFTVTATDAAKNVSDISSTFTVNVDAAAPAAPVIGSANDDAGRIKGDLASGQATDDALPVFKGTAEAGSRVELFDAGVSLGTVKVDKAGGWIFTPAELKDGGHNFTATATDSTGNISPASAAFTLTVNTRQPKTPDITRVSDDVGRIKGVVDSGSTTDDTTLSLTGKAGSNSTVEIFDGSLSLGSVTTGSGGAWSFETPILAEGNHILTAVASNAVGSPSRASDTFAVTIRTQPPLAPVISTIQDDVGKTIGSVANNGKTDDTTPTLSGTATAGVTVEVLDYDARLASVTADEDGQWSYTTETLENGSIHVFSARAMDDSGLVSASGNDYTLTINTGAKDTTPPFAPTITAVSDDQEPNTGSVNNKGKSNDATLTLIGTAEANSTVEIFDGEDSLGTVKADKGGDWTFTTSALKDGSRGFTATATDAAKNASEASKSYTITTDATAPTLDLSSDKANLKAGETAAITFNFSESPTGFETSDVTVTG